jgi:broad specificity phosphatase PhoE
VTTILLARHGESDWNVEQRWQGHADRPLTERGRAQAEALAVRLDEFPLTAVYASDLLRASATARVVAERRDLPVVLRRDLREVDVGDWSGLTRAELEARDPESIRRWLEGEKGWDGGESYEEMARRVVRTVTEIAAAHPGEHVLAVTHGGCVRAVHARALGITFHAHRRSAPVEPNARLSAVAVEDGAIRLLHLPDRPVGHQP